MRYYNGIFSYQPVLYLVEHAVTADRNNFISDLEHLVGLFLAFYAYGYSLESLVFRSFEYLQSRMRADCRYFIWYNHTRGNMLFYIKFAVFYNKNHKKEDTKLVILTLIIFYIIT